MATTNLITNITKNGDYPISVTCSATNNCGLLSLMLSTQWTEQMLYELPTLNIKIFMSDGTQLVSFDVDMSTVNRDTLEQSEPYSIPIYNLPSDFTFSITPLFDKYALQAHNDQINTGDFGSFTTSETGIVDTNIKDYSSLYWTTPTQTFNISIDFDDSNIVAGGGSGGGGGGGSITIDTQVNGTSTNAVQNKAIYNFVNSSVATNTANFIDTFNSVEELEAYTGTVTNNDYAFVIGTDSEGNTVYNRYKYNGSEWVFEYTLNNSSFTAAQWATIQSGLTASDKTKLDGIEPGANKTVVDENLSATSTNPVQNKTVNTALAAKQDTIIDLTNIRSGAAAGSTAVQPADMSAALTLKQDKLTFDSTPTESSTNPVTSGGVWADQQRQETEIGVVANAGAKNLLYISNTPGYTATSHGRTFTVLSDGGIKITGESSDSSNADFYIIGSWGNRSILLNENKDSCLIRMTCDTDYGYNQIRLRVMNRSTGSTVNDTGVETNKDVQLSHVITTVFVSVFPSVTLPEDGIVVYPMIRRAEITDDTFVPYAPTNRELYDDLQRQETEIGVVANAGAKNAFNPADYIANSRSGVTITYNGDGTYSLSGTPTQTSDYLYTPDNVYNDLYGLQAGQPYTISTGVESSKVLVRIIPSYDGVSYDWSRPLVNNASVKATFTIPDDVVGLLIDFRSTANAGSLNGIVLKPMIRPAEITDDTFVPYAKTNRELTVAGDEDRAALIQQVDGGAKNLAVPRDLAPRSDLTIINDKGQYTITGTTTSAFTGYLFLPAEPLQITTDCVIIGAEQLTGLDYNVAYRASAGSSMRFEHVGAKKILPSGAVISNIYVQQNTVGIAVSANIKLMLCTAADYAISPAFVPYRPSWQELTTKEQQNENNILFNLETGVKNCLPVNQSYTLSQNGHIFQDLACNVPAGNYQLRFTSTLSTNFIFVLQDSNGNNLARIQPTMTVGNNTFDVTINANAVKTAMYVTAPQGITISNMMLCSPQASSDYQGYAPSNRELYEMIQALQNGS